MESHTQQPTRYAIVTGGGSGIGRALCRRLVACGWTVAVANIDTAAAAETTELLRAEGVGRQAIVADLDVRDAAAWRQMIARLEDRWPRLDLLINNAGTLACGPLHLADEESLRRIVDVNLTGVMNGCGIATPWLARSVGKTPVAVAGSPRSGIINTASIFATVAPPGFAAYSATKAAVVALSESLRGELSAAGLNVTVALPGASRTSLFASADYSDEASRRATDAYVANAGLTPDDIARQMLAAAARGKPRVVIGRRAQRYALLQRLLPKTFRSVIERRAREAFAATNQSQAVDHAADPASPFKLEHAAPEIHN